MATHDNIHITNAVSEGCITLPAETIYHILRFVEPQDLIHLRAVSKQFQAIVRDPAIWRTIYATACLPLPPGPFAWQSTHFLQRALVHSARLARTWATEHLKIVSKEIYTGPRTIDKDRFRWVSGRWLIVSKDMNVLRARDIETGSEHVLWDNASFAAWAATSLITPHAHLLLVIIHLQRGYLSDPMVLLEFVVDDETGNLSGPETFRVPTWVLSREEFVPHIAIDRGLGPYVYISLDAASKPRSSLIFTPGRRQFYKFPCHRTQVDLLINYVGAWLPHLVETYFTETYVFVLSRSYLIHGFLGEVELIQTFAFPDIDTNAYATLVADSDPNTVPGPFDNSTPTDVTRPIVHELRLTHEVFTRNARSRSVWLTPIRDATVDPVTKSTTLRFMDTFAPFYTTPDSRVQLVCTDYILPTPPPAPNRVRAGNGNNSSVKPNWNTIIRSTYPILPITVISHEIFSALGEWRGNLVHASHDGFVRGLCMVDLRTAVGNSSGVGADDTPPIETDKIHKFAVDARGERCVAVVGDPCSPLEGMDLTRHFDYSIDTMRGKIWFTKWDVLERTLDGKPVDRDVLAVVVDLK